MKIVKINKKVLDEVVQVINAGQIIIFPTDTVYGFLVDAENKKAVNKIYKIKKRSKTKPLPVFVKDFKMAKNLAKISEKQEEILKKYWPGKCTFVLSLLRGVKATKQSKTIALRIPKYKPLNDLLKKINKPLAQTSVNISGKKELNKISEIILEFGKKDIFIVDAGDLKKSKSSKIIDLTKNKIEFIRK